MIAYINNKKFGSADEESCQFFDKIVRQSKLYLKLKVFPIDNFEEQLSHIQLSTITQIISMLPFEEGCDLCCKGLLIEVHISILDLLPPEILYSANLVSRYHHK